MRLRRLAPAVIGLLIGCSAVPQGRKAVQAPGGPVPIGPYSHAVVEGDFVFVSGQGPIDPKTGEYLPGDIQAETRRTFEYMKAILEAAGSSLDKVVKVNVYLRDIKDFAGMNEVYKTMFAPPYPARTTIQAAALPRGIAVEIECVARR